jgi:NAD(P)-dependent dehydrogenase (short-subunit alcohol dehydrogenase family)
LVGNAWGGYEQHDETFGDPFWDQPVSRWDMMFTAGLRAQFTAARLAARQMIDQGHGLITLTGGFDDLGSYLGAAPYDVVKTATSRLVTAMGHELRPYGVASVGVYPGFTRTEAVVAAFVAEDREPPLETHTPAFVGRAVASVLGDPDVMRFTGTGAQAATYARRYGFTDVDGRVIEPFALPDEYRLVEAAF